MTTVRPCALDQPVNPDKWSRQRDAERITPTDLPHLNSTMRGTYVPHELNYRGRQVVPDPSMQHPLKGMR